MKYCIYSINRPGRLLSFWTLGVGAHSRWALIKFTPFSASVVCLFCHKTINANNKTRRSNKARFCKILWRKLRSRGSLLLVLIQFQFQSHCHSSGWALIWVWLGGGGVAAWALIRGWALINFFCLWDGCLFEVVAYSRWALIRGWALIRINTVDAI